MLAVSERKVKKVLFLIASKIVLAAGLVLSVAVPVFAYGQGEHGITSILMLFPVSLLLGSMALSMLLHNPFSERNPLHYPFIISFALGGVWAPIFLYHISNHIFMLLIGLFAGLPMLMYALHLYRDRQVD